MGIFLIGHLFTCLAYHNNVGGGEGGGGGGEIGVGGFSSEFVAVDLCD